MLLNGQLYQFSRTVRFFATFQFFESRNAKICQIYSFFVAFWAEKCKACKILQELDSKNAFSYKILQKFL